MASIKDLLVIIKDKVELSRAAVASKSKNHALNLSLLKATTRDRFTPPHPKYIAALLSYGLGSRATAATAIEALMDRLQSAKDSSVSIKCLVLVHHIIKHGSFILIDQLTVYPTTGGRNYLNLSNFRDASSLVAWELSSWVRWYARYLEHQICTSRLLGFVLAATSNALERERENDKIRSHTNIGLIHEMGCLAALIEESCKRPEPLLRISKMVEHIIDMVRQDVLSLIDVISSRSEELKHRLGCLSFQDSMELASVLKRLEGCRHGISALFYGAYVSMDSLWLPLADIKHKVELDKPLDAGKGRFLISCGEEEWSRSHRFHDRVVKHNDGLKFSSARFVGNGL